MSLRAKCYQFLFILKLELITIKILALRLALKEGLRGTRSISGRLACQMEHLQLRFLYRSLFLDADIAMVAMTRVFARVVRIPKCTHGNRP